MPEGTCPNVYLRRLQSPQTQEHTVHVFPSPRRLARLSAVIVAMASTVLLPACSDEQDSLGPSPDLTAHAVSTLAYLEPSGMTLLAANDWAGFGLTTPAVGGSLSGWYRYMAGNTGVTATAAGAGCGSNSTLQVTFKQGSSQGVGPEHLGIGASSTWMTSKGSFTQLYVRYCIWVPANYVGPTNGIQKIFHIWGTTDGSAYGTSQAVPALYSVGSGPISHQLRLQNMSTTNGGSISFNIGCTSAARGRWDRVELLLTQNTGGSANGVARMWVNGTQCMQRTNLTWSGAARTGKRWTAVQLNPTYGTSGKVATTQIMRYGAVRISAR